IIPKIAPASPLPRASAAAATTSPCSSARWSGSTHCFTRSRARRGARACSAPTSRFSPPGSPFDMTMPAVAQQPSSPAAVPASGWSRHRGAALLGVVLLVVVTAAALSVDVVRAGYGIKADEATYVSMAMSVAYDGNLTYERRDLERFTGLYRVGPEGLFLKRGSIWHLRRASEFPYLRLSREPDPRADRLYFGKSYLYPIV